MTDQEPRRSDTADPDTSRLIDELGHPEPAVRKAAAVALGERGDLHAIPALSALLNDSDCPVRLAAVEALGRIGGLQVISPLMDALTDENEQVRAAAAFGLAE
jgi:HEAT repeat protein